MAGKQITMDQSLFTLGKKGFPLRILYTAIKAFLHMQC